MEHLPKVLWPQSFSFSFPLETYWETRTIYFWKYWIEYLIFPGVIFILMGNSRRPVSWRSNCGISGIKKSGKFWRGGETVLTQVWCILPDNTALLMTSWKILLRAPTCSRLSWFGFKLNCSIIHRLHAITCPASPPLRSCAPFLRNFLLSLEKQSEKLHNSSILRISLVLSLKSGSYLKGRHCLSGWGMLQGYQLNPCPLSNQNVQSPMLYVCLISYIVSPVP